MTSVVCWLANEEPKYQTLWVAADSLISSTSLSGSPAPMLDIMSKISSIPIKVTFMYSDKVPLQDSNIGFAFAGSSLVASATKDTLALLLSSLCPLDLNPRFPSLREIVDLAFEVFIGVLDSFLKNTFEIQPSCEILIFGYCNSAKEFGCYKISHQTRSPNSRMEKMPLLRNDDEFLPIIIGDKIEEVKKLISQKRDSLTGLGRERAPMYALIEMITSSEQQTIGGQLQLACCNPVIGTTIYGIMSKALENYYYGYNPHTRLSDGRQLLKTLGGFIISPPVLYLHHNKDS